MGRVCVCVCMCAIVYFEFPNGFGEDYSSYYEDFCYLHYKQIKSRKTQICQITTPSVFTNMFTF